MIRTETWNGTEWVYTDTPSPTPNWQEDIRTFNANLPIDLGEEQKHLVVDAFNVTGKNSCELIFKMPKSKFDTGVSNSEIDEYFNSARLFMQEVRKLIPSSIIITGVLRDSKGRTLKTIRK